MDTVTSRTKFQIIAVVMLMMATMLVTVANSGPALAGDVSSFTVTRLSGSNRFATGVAVSQEMYPSGAYRVYVAMGYNFPDALAAGGGLSGPILLTNTAALPTDVLAEIVRLAPVEVFVVGGTAVISPDVVAELNAAGSWSVTRLSGSNRFATGVAVSQEMYPFGADRVYVAMGYDFPDALAAGGGLPGPILLTNVISLPSNVLSEIVRLGPAEVFVIGGTAVVSPSVITQLKAAGPWTVTRVSGSNRFATGVALSQEMYPTGANRVYIATGYNFPDALAAGGGLPGPILLTNPSTIPQDVLAEIIRLGVTEVFIIGGTAAISPGVATQTKTAVETTVDDPVQRAALVALYNVTGGLGWNSNTNWLTAASYCTWYGVICGAQHNIETLNLSNNWLAGSIPSELGNLANLNYLDLSDNLLSGQIPAELGNLINLINLDVRNNSLWGSIPSELGNLTNLNRLYLSDNSLSGSIPSELGNLTNLNHLYLYENVLSGPIPSELGNLTSLNRLFLYNNFLSGSIPSELGNLTDLNNLNLANNLLTGMIPSGLGNLTELTTLYLFNNSLSGSIPSELGNLTKVFLMFLHNNSLSGAVPFGLMFGLSSLTGMSLSGQSGCLTTGTLSGTQLISLRAWLNSFDSNWNDGC